MDPSLFPEGFFKHHYRLAAQLPPEEVPRGLRLPLHGGFAFLAAPLLEETPAYLINNLRERGYKSSGAMSQA